MAPWRHISADNHYLLVSQQLAFTLLRRLEDINPAFASCIFRHAAGLEPVPQHKEIGDWIASKDYPAASLFDIDIKLEPRLLVSIKEGAPGMEVADDPYAYSDWLSAEMCRQGATYAIGLYGEVRTCYSTEAFTNAACPERRSQHLGLDVFLPAGTPLYAPLAGRVYSVVDNAGHLDYGGTVILEHQAGAGGPAFYTLYGHLARKTLEILAEGQSVAAGELIGTLGEPAENGGWAPHVHFQIMTDMLGMSGHFHGAGEPSLWPVWQKICLDPNLLIGLPPEAFAVDSTPPDVLLKNRKRLLGPSLSKTSGGGRANRHSRRAGGKRRLGATCPLPNHDRYAGHEWPFPRRWRAQSLAGLAKNLPRPQPSDRPTTRGFCRRLDTARRFAEKSKKTARAVPQHFL